MWKDGRWKKSKLIKSMYQSELLNLHRQLAYVLLMKINKINDEKETEFIYTIHKVLVGKNQFASVKSKF